MIASPLVLENAMADGDLRSAGDISSGQATDSGDSRWKKGLKAAGRSLSSSGQSMMDQSRSDSASRIGPVTYHSGGKVRKGGNARLLKGERVIPRSKVKRVEKLMKRSKMRMKSSGRG